MKVLQTILLILVAIELVNSVGEITSFDGTKLSSWGQTTLGVQTISGSDRVNKNSYINR